MGYKNRGAFQMEGPSFKYGFVILGYLISVTESKESLFFS